MVTSQGPRAKPIGSSWIQTSILAPCSRSSTPSGAMGSPASGARTFVFSRTLRPGEHPNVTIIAEVSASTVAPIRAQARKDIWLFGGGTLFRSFLDAGLVDTVEVAVMPVLLGGGVPLLPNWAHQTKLTLTGHRIYNTGIVLLEYGVKKLAA
jgi:dihydrofolate reductase